MKILLKRNLKTLLGLAAGMATMALSTTASAEGAEPIVIYKVTVAENYQLLTEDVNNKGAFKYSYFLVTYPDMNAFRTVQLFRGKKYRIDNEFKFFSQSFVSTDEADRERRVISFSGPGVEWEVRDDPGSDQAQLETIIGRVRTIQSRLFNARVDMRAPTAMKGAGRYEYAHGANRRRELSKTKISIRLSRRITDLANAKGGGLNSSTSELVDYLEVKGWKDLFADD